MDTILATLSDAPLIPWIGAAFGLAMLGYGVFAGESKSEIRARRMAFASAKSEQPAADVGLIKGDGTDVRGLLKAFVPQKSSEQFTIQRQMQQAGIKNPNAVWMFFLAKVLFAVGLPLAYIAVSVLPSLLNLSSEEFASYLASPATSKNLMFVALSVLIGFYAPSWWLKSRISDRQQKIWENLPISLDLLQISIGAGVGFDAALVRVANEIADIAPEIAEEFMMAEMEIQAGKDRKKAFMDMADRSGVEEMRAFANTIVQASEYGTNLSSALNTFAEEMRRDREYKAQEKANKLPVKMSGIVAAFMMPVLLLMTLGPIAVLWVTT